jgi:hypothetical protein
VLPLLLSEYHPKDILPCRRVMIVFQSSLRWEMCFQRWKHSWGQEE